MSEDKRAQIMRAVEELFSSRRFHEITIEDVARKAGVGKGTVYRYFTDKDELFFQVAMAGYDDLCQVVADRVEDTGNFPDVFRAVCDQVGAFFSRRHRVFHLMQTEDRRSSRRRGHRRAVWRTCKSQLIATVSQLIIRGQAESFFRSDIPAEELAAYLLAVLRAGVQSPRCGERNTQPLDLAVDLFLNGVRPPTTWSVEK